MKKLHKVLDGKIYKNMLTAVTKVIELHDISDEQDDLMVAKMMEAGIDDAMTMDQYQEIYRSLDNYDQRIYQINLSADVTRIFHGLSKKWIVALSLKTVKTTAALFGIREIIDFIDPDSDFNFGYDSKKLDSLIAAEASEKEQLKALGMTDDAGFMKKLFYKQGLKFYKNKYGVCRDAHAFAKFCLEMYCGIM